jgi:hypothetical protein
MGKAQELLDQVNERAISEEQMSVLKKMSSGSLKRDSLSDEDMQTMEGLVALELAMFDNRDLKGDAKLFLTKQGEEFLAKAS